MQGRAELMLAPAREAKEEVNSFLCVEITLIQEKKQHNKKFQKKIFFLFGILIGVCRQSNYYQKKSVCLRAFDKQHFPAAHVLFKNATSP